MDFFFLHGKIILKFNQDIQFFKMNFSRHESVVVVVFHSEIY
jgi:hypothetical protein